MNSNTRLNGSDSLLEASIKMSDGNPGALQVVMSLMQSPFDFVLLLLLACDSIGLYGEKLYMLWNDCCDRDMSKFKRVIRNWQRGKLSAEDILQHVSGAYGTPF